MSISNYNTFSEDGLEALINHIKAIRDAGVDTEATGRRGAGILWVTTAPEVHTWDEDDWHYSYFGFLLSDVKRESGMTEVLINDIILNDNNLYRVSRIVDDYVVLIGPATSIKGDPGADGISFETNDTLQLKDGILSVNTADVVEEDNTLPITSAAVFTTVGNIEALLKTI